MRLLTKSLKLFIWQEIKSLTASPRWEGVRKSIQRGDSMEKKFKKGMLKRILIFALAVVFLFCVDGGRVLYLQTFRADELAEKAQSQQLSDTEVTAMRGTIYDSEGNVLAQSATVWNIFIDPKNIDDEKERNLIVDNLAELLKFDEKQKEELYENSKKESRYVVIGKKVENDIKEAVAKFSAENKETDVIGFEQTTRRYYPHNSLASAVIGFTGSDNQGLMGVESYYEEELKGTNGRIVTVKDANSNKLPTDYETSIEAMDGNSLVLTINQTVQYYLEKGLRTTMEEYKAKGAYGIVMDCNTGAILAMSSMPDFDCNDPYAITYKKTKKELNKIKDKDEKAEAQSLAIQNQWRNFTVSDTYVPGSVFKTFMASAALEENIVTLDTSYNCTGSIQVKNYRMHCHYHPGHGTQNLTQGLENSCNPFFITIGQKMGVHTYFKYFDAFGFTQKTGVDLPGEAMSQYYREEQYGIVELSSASFGQTNSITPIQVVCGLSAIANGGTLLKPYVVSEIKDANGNTVKKTQKTEVRRVISEETSEKVRTMMKAVVDEGTGKNGYVAGYRVGGKTGTSTKLGESKEGERTKYIVSFAAIAPADDPRIAMLIIMDEPNEDLGGGALCAPIAAQVIEQALPVLNVEPKYDEDEMKNLSFQTPNVIGKNVSAATKTLEDKGLRYKVVGEGDKVINQSPSSNVNVPAKGMVVLYTEKGDKKTVKVPDFTGLTISEANRLAAESNLNIEINGNNLSISSVMAYRQSIDDGSKVDMGSVITVSFKNTNSVLD
ncbi:MAG: PASTA domain-containing protein [Ruminococcaceae bacterium]|nr:PASTA domain-containing protein [Oscillospiraceae bacterium]